MSVGIYIHIRILCTSVGIYKQVLVLCMSVGIYTHTHTHTHTHLYHVGCSRLKFESVPFTST